MTGRRWLVAGSYPPVPGAPAAATVAAVRRAWAAGDEVAVASPRPSAAPDLVPAAGPALGRQLAALGHRRGCDGAIVCIEPGWPLDPRHHPVRTARALAAGLAGLGRVELVVTGPVVDLEPVLAAMAPLVAMAGAVTVAGPALAAALTAAGTTVHTTVQTADPFAGAGLVPPPAGEADGAGGAVPPVAPVAPVAPVGPREPGAMLLGARARRVASRTARAVLGRHAPAVRAAAHRVARPVHRRAG